MDQRLHEEGYSNKGIVAAESWICWDGKRTVHGPEGSGDTVESTLRIFGECIQRGLSLTNLPWTDNNSAWTMGLTKRLDYNGRLASLGEKLNPNFTGGPAIATRKLNLLGSDEKFTINNDSPAIANGKFGAPYAVAEDPNHTHYYIWRWYAQLSAGQNESIHHAIAGEEGNDIELTGGNDKDFMRMSSFDRTAKRFIVLVARKKAKKDPQELTISIPAMIQKGARYNRDEEFIGEGFKEGEQLRVVWTTEDVEPKTGYRKNKTSGESSVIVVTNGQLTFSIPQAYRLTSVIFESLQR